MAALRLLLSVLLTSLCSGFVPSSSLSAASVGQRHIHQERRTTVKMPPLDPSAGQSGIVDGSNTCNSYLCSLFGSPSVAAPERPTPAEAARATTILPTAMATTFHNMASWKKSTLILLALALFCAVVMIYLSHSKGAQRIYQFWSAVTPWIVEYKCIKWNAKYIQKLPEEAVRQRMAAFHKKTAPKAVALAQRMGGIYVKMGQIISTVAVGILHDDYIQALRPLQDGIPPRSLDEMATIFEMSTGNKLGDVFEWVEEKPIGAASIGQAHKAMLKKRHPSDPDDVVVVKLQYPEVAELFNADLNNLELCIRLVAPGSRDMVVAMRERHSRELDFRDEAKHLRECSDNMAKHGFEPRHVRIPRVRNETGLCTQHVLVMEYLQGTTLHAAIEQEQDRMARALGKKSGKAMREFILEQIGEQLDPMNQHNDTHAGGGGDWSSIGAGGGAELNRFQRFAMGPVGAAVFRAYVNARNGLHNVREGLVGLVQGHDQGHERRRKGRPIQMGRVLKTLVHVHGLQILRDGVYNADPHPGNVLILPDGRIGLLDYGMVGRVTPEQRKSMAQTILALHRHDKHAVSDLYKNAGYRATWKEGDIMDDVNILHRIATIHFDKFDLSAVNVLMRDTLKNTTNDNHKHNKHNLHLPRLRQRKHVKLMDILQSTQEWAVPDWVEQGRRLTGLLSGVAIQSGRPMSIAKEWHAIAEEVMEEVEEAEDEQFHKK